MPAASFRTELISDLMHHLDRDGSLDVGECDDELRKRIEGLDLPMLLKRVFQWNWARKYSGLGRYRISPVDRVFSGEWFERFISSRMLGIASAYNGDVVVLRLVQDRCEVGLIDATTFAGEDEAAPDAFYVKICDSLDELLWRMAEGRFLPMDYQSAIELHELKTDVQVGTGDLGGLEPSAR